APGRWPGTAAARTGAPRRTLTLRDQLVPVLSQNPLDAALPPTRRQAWRAAGSPEVGDPDLQGARPPLAGLAKAGPSRAASPSPWVRTAQSRPAVSGREGARATRAKPPRAGRAPRGP